MTGIIKTPFSISGSLGKAIFGNLRENVDGVTEKDLELIKMAVNQVLYLRKIGYALEWSNPKSGNDGTVTLKKFVEIDMRDCRTLSFEIRKDKKVYIRRDITFCLNENSEWKAINQ